MLECDFCGCYSPSPREGLGCLPRRGRRCARRAGCPELLPALRSCRVRLPSRRRHRARLRVETGAERRARAQHPRRL